MRGSASSSFTRSAQRAEARERDERPDPAPGPPGNRSGVSAATATTWVPHSRARSGPSAQRRYRSAASMSFRRPASSGLTPLL